jgi:hypothetical protein
VSVETIPATDFVVERGDSLTIRLGPVTTENEAGVKVAEDLTLGGTKIWLTVKNSWDDTDATAVVQLTEASGITINSPATAAKNYATAAIGDDKFADVTTYAERKVLVWDAVFERGARHERIARGKITVVPSVTRAT